MYAVNIWLSLKTIAAEGAKHQISFLSIHHHGYPSVLHRLWLLVHPQYRASTTSRVFVLTAVYTPVTLDRHVASFGHPDRILPIALGTRVGRHVQFMDRIGAEAMYGLALGRAVALVVFSRCVL